LSEITIQGGQFEDFQYDGSSFEVRVKVSDTFTASDGSLVSSGEGFYQSVTLDSSGNYSAHTLQSTRDGASLQNCSYKYEIWVDGEYRQTYRLDDCDSYIVPASPTTQSLADLATATRAFRNVRSRNLSEGYFTTTQSDARYLLASSGGAVRGSYAYAGLPAAGSAGVLYRLTDKYRGLMLDTGDDLVSVTGEVFNVKTFGAQGDGTTNDTAAIQTAITAAIAYGGGEVFCPPGTYKVTQTGGTALTVQGDNVTLRGVKGKSRIAMASGTGDTLVFGTGHGRGQRLQGGRDTVPAFGYENLRLGGLRAGLQKPDHPRREIKGRLPLLLSGVSYGCRGRSYVGRVGGGLLPGLFCVRVIQGYFYGLETDGLRNEFSEPQLDGYCEGLNFFGGLFINELRSARRPATCCSPEQGRRPPEPVQPSTAATSTTGSTASSRQNAYSYSFVPAAGSKGRPPTGCCSHSTAHEFIFEGCQFFNSGANGLYRQRLVGPRHQGQPVHQQRGGDAELSGRPGHHRLGRRHHAGRTASASRARRESPTAGPGLRTTACRSTPG
jgi:hypothetical protein